MSTAGATTPAAGPPRTKRRRRIPIKGPITGLLLIGIVGYGAYWGWQNAFGTTEVVANGCPTTAVSPSASSTATPSVTLPTTGAPAAGRVLIVPAAAATTTAPAPPATTATPTGPVFLQPAQVTVNVYNASDVNGLAVQTADALRDRGFKIGSIANDPLGKDIPGVAEVRARSADLASVRLLIQHVPGATFVVNDSTDDTVDLVLGDTFTALGNPATVTPVAAPTVTRCATS